MATIAETLINIANEISDINDSVQSSKINLANNLTNKSIAATSSETLTALINKVNDIEIGSGSALSIDILLVGGGGGGSGGSSGSFEGCGGGAGGCVYRESLLIVPKTYSVVIGAGGLGGAGGQVGLQGSHSVFDNMLFAIGGGGGRNIRTLGGSGGGSSSTVANINYGIAGQGNDGGTSNSSAFGGAGGGAGGVGGNGVATGNPSAIGGSGLQFDISGTALWYCGGGGCAGTTGVVGGLGGSGVGGKGADWGFVGGNAVTNTGSGGGGGSSFRSLAGGKGSGGVCIIRYKTGTISATGGTITTSGIYTIHTFTSSETFTVESI